MALRFINWGPKAKISMGYRYLTFDCYGTLIDWRTGIERELASALGDISLRGQDLLNAYGKVEREEEAAYKKYRDVLRRSVLAMSGVLGVDVDEEAARRFAASVPRWPAFPDTAEFLRGMGGRGYKRYILSNVDNDLLEGTIKNNRLEVDGFVTAEEVGSYKPRTGHWVEFLRRTGATKDDVLHVAQSVYHDIIPTQRLGIASAWVNRYAEPLPPDASPSIISDSLASLSKMVE
jgi:2-haloalkanoic acid dehalogenase type II